MKTVFNSAIRNELMSRINSLNENSKPLWGKMTLFQMTTHCTIWNEWVLGKKDFVYKQDLLGKVFGKMALKSNTKDEQAHEQKYAGWKRIYRKRNGRQFGNSKINLGNADQIV